MPVCCVALACALAGTAVAIRHDTTKVHRSDVPGSAVPTTLGGQ
jgi:hypothetical protein